MDRKHVIVTLILMVCLVGGVSLTGCEKGTPSSEDEAAATSETTASSVTATPAAPEAPVSELSAIVIDSGLGTIDPNGSTDVVATAYNESGSTVSDVAVKFVVDNPALASVGSSATTGSDGTATVTFQAREKTGTSTITASSGDVTSDPLSITIQTAVVVGDPGEFTLSLDPTKVLAKGTATVTAEVRDSSGNQIPAGTDVTFEVADENFGEVDPITAKTNAAGIATATFTASSQPGKVNINVTATNITSRSIEVEVLGSDPAAIRFVSTDRSTIAVQEAGGVETTRILFEVTDGNNDPVPAQKVSFTMVGPEGGEYIDESDDGSPETLDVSTDENGIATVILHSGRVAGPVTIQASIDVRDENNVIKTITVRSPIVSIGGGVASDKRFAPAASVLNLPGLQYRNRQTQLTAYLADRFGNYNILEGTTVSFSPEWGLASFSNGITEATVDAQGAATVTLRTQNVPEDVEPDPWEKALQRAVWLKYRIDFAASDGHPRDGVCSVLLHTRGEEHFNDSNANGFFDDSNGDGILDVNDNEDFDDTDEDPFVDFNDDGKYTDSSDPNDPEELYIDSGDNGKWDGENTKWDNDKKIFRNFPFLITGSPVIAFDLVSASITCGGSQEISVLICDVNMNILSGGTTISISSDVGKLSGATSVTVADTNMLPLFNGAPNIEVIEYGVTFSDGDPKVDKKEAGAITVKVTWEGGVYIETLGAVVDSDA